MASITRRFVKTNFDDQCHLKFVIKDGRHHRWEVVSRIKLPLDYWSAEKRVQRNHPACKKLNTYIDRLEAHVRMKALELLDAEVHDQRIVQNNLNTVVLNFGTPEEVYLELPLDNNEYSGFYDFAEQFIFESEATKARGTIKTYKQAIARLKAFNPNLDFDDFDLNFYYRFLAFLKREGITNNTMGKHVKVLKTILNEATERGVNTKLEFRKRKFKVFKEEVDSVYLSVEELEALIRYKEQLTDPKRRICDLFLLGCYTGLRFSDISSLTVANFFNDETGTYILQRNQKTSQQVVIPLNLKAREILTSYNGNIPKTISNQKTNKALKEICRNAGFDRQIETKRRIGGETIVKVWKKYELISTHTARRSFATNAFLAGVPVLAIMKITGHKTEKAFMQYIKASQLENAIVLAQHPFFR